MADQVTSLTQKVHIDRKVVVVEDHIRPRRLRQLLNQVDLVVALK